MLVVVAVAAVVVVVVVGAACKGIAFQPSAVKLLRRLHCLSCQDIAFPHTHLFSFCSPYLSVQEVTGKEVPKEVDVMNIRKHVFTNWANYVLRKAESRSVLVDLCSDVQNGLVVLELLKVLNRERPIAPYHARPRIKEEMIKNHQITFEFLQREGVETATIGSKGGVEWMGGVGVFSLK